MSKTFIAGHMPLFLFISEVALGNRDSKGKHSHGGLEKYLVLTLMYVPKADGFGLRETVLLLMAYEMHLKKMRKQNRGLILMHMFNFFEPFYRACPAMLQIDCLRLSLLN